jgi:hypothetical protein
MRRFVSVSLVLCFLLLTACTPKVEPSAFRTDTEAHLTLPAGVWYRSGAQAWDDDCLPMAFYAVFFEKVPAYDWVLYLGTDPNVFCEILYAVCESTAQAAELAAFLAAHLDKTRALADGMYSESFADAAVVRRGKTVIYTACPVNAKVLGLVR